MIILDVNQKKLKQIINLELLSIQQPFQKKYRINKHVIYNLRQIHNKIVTKCKTEIYKQKDPA